MDLDTSSIAKLWLEEHETQKSDLFSEQVQYSVKKFNLTKNQLKLNHTFCQKNGIQPIILLHAAWALLLNRLSTTDNINYAAAPATANKSAIHIALENVKRINSTIDDKILIKKFIANIKAQINKKNKNQQETFVLNEIRYLLLTKTTNKKHKSMPPLDANHFPLLLLVDPKKPINLTFFHNPYIISDKNIKRIYDYLLLVMNELCSAAKQKVVELNLLTAPESKKILSRWGRPKYNFPVPVLTVCAHDIFRQIAEKTPKKIAINHNDVNITYQQLDMAANALAGTLLQEGVQAGDRICILMERTPELIMAMLAIFKLGAIYVPINPKYPKERIEYIIDHTQARHVLINSSENVAEKHHAKCLVINESCWQPNKANNIFLPTINPEQVAYIIYTSGTTGEPKGVMIRHKSLANLITWYQGCFTVSAKDRSCQFASQGFDPFFCETIPFLCSGASVHIVDDNIKLTPSLFFDWLKQQKITVCDLPTAYAQMLFTMTWPKNMDLRLVKIGGESVTHYPTQAFPFDIWDGYGPTETTVETTYAQLYSANTAPNARKKHFPPPIGKPIINNSAYVVDKYMQPVPVGIGGELLVGGICVSAGYWQRDDLTAEKFIMLPHLSQEKLYRTGDLVRWLADGNLEFIGRTDHQVKIRGYRIELSEIENAISQHTDVSEVIVLVKETVNNEKSIIAYVAPNLDKERYLYQERCLLSLDRNKFMEALTEDISKEGIALTGITETIQNGQLVQLHIKLPGFTESKLLSGHVIWQQANRCGIKFDLNEEERAVLIASIDYHLYTHNVTELILTTAAKRNLRKALRKQLPEYMIPSVLITLMQFPLTFSGKIDVKALPPPQEFEQLLQKTFIPAKSATENKLSAIWRKLLNINSISMSDSFFDLGGSSLSAAALSMEILKQFDISMPTKILFDLPFIPILAEYIDTNGKKYTQRSVLQEEIARDKILPDNIVPTKNMPINSLQPQNILLTGAGGFLGVYLLKDLLEHTDAKIYCLVRKSQFATAAKRLITNIEKYALTDKVSLTNRRIIVIPSDISLDNFGLPAELYNSLLDKIDFIYHCGAQVSIMAAYNKLRGSNVQGTLEIIKFATTHVDKPIHYISTLSAAYKKDEHGHLAEEFPDEDFQDLFGGYAISKWVSERLLTQLIERGGKAAIYRSGYITGQADNGVTSTNDALLMLIKGCIQLGFAPDLNEKITMLPIDFVSAATVKISLTYPNQPHVYHLDHPTGILWSDLIAWINHYGYTIKIIPIHTWKKKLLALKQDNALFPFLPYYLSLAEDYKTPETSIEYTKNILKELEMAYPAINDRLLTVYFDYLCQVNFLPPPKFKLQRA
jgi:amino acid adenylation domain-containing protein/thioester reductase-like protein